MTRFKIKIETRQYWEIETDAKNAEEAKQIQGKIYDQIQATIENIENETHDAVLMGGALGFENQSTDKFSLKETWGADDFSDDDIENMDVQELPEAERASLTAKYCLFSTCPECGTETEYDDEHPEYGRIMDDMNGNGYAVIKCPDCGTEYKQTSYKEY